GQGLDVTLELGPIGQDDARRLDVADHDPVVVELHLPRRVDVALHPAADREVPGRDLGLHLAARVDRQVLRAGDLAADGPLDHQPLVTALDLAFHLDRAAEYGLVRLVVHRLPSRTPGPDPGQMRSRSVCYFRYLRLSSAGSSNVMSTRPFSLAPS